ncbi:hypothetical protein O1611_g2560 [Lasiodiplodia mahajangana]|uniref:Uncharacterized protein n=1 Tax=Lasiodiplodia mahajangana TaxID=1108764 RepID=A0ACC2JUX6_9PEZI|nr:hypothetical protein O1611_g2560 [Lasiodiplodia mahajangana]
MADDGSTEGGIEYKHEDASPSDTIPSVTSEDATHPSNWPGENYSPQADTYPSGYQDNILGLQQVKWELSELDLSSMEAQRALFRIILLPKAEGLGISAYGRPTDRSEGSGNWRFANVKGAPKGTAPTKLFAMSWDDEHVGCRVDHWNTTKFVIYFNPWQDHAILRNFGLSDIQATRVDEGNVGEVEHIAEGLVSGCLALDAGEWIVADGNEFLVEVKVLERTEWAVSHQPAKRQAGCSTNLPKKTRVLADLAADGATYQTGVSEANASGHALLDLSSGQTIHVGSRDGGESTYRLKRLEPVAHGTESSIWKGEHSKFPRKLVAVKVLKPKDNTVSSHHPYSTAEDWIRKVTILSSLGDHFSLVNYLGADARFYSIYTEFVDAQPLDQHVTGPDDNPQFCGNVQGAWRILNDMAAALSFIHQKGVVHGDIRPGNILYNPQRGAFLVGFGNGLCLEDPEQPYRWPWYIPPEFLYNPSSLGSPADMFALGVVMLWVLHRIRLPECAPFWNIKDVHPTAEIQAEHNRAAQNQMILWAEIIRLAASTPSIEGGAIDSIVNALLEKKRDRIDALKLESRVVGATQTPPKRVE